MRNPRVRFALASLCALGSVAGVAACASPIKTAHDVAPDADFARYRTYAWISDETLLPPRVGVARETYVSPIDDQRIRAAVDSELAKKGYRPAPAATADLIVSFAVGSEQKVQIESVPGRSTTYAGGYGYGSWYAHSTTRARTYTEGTLILEFYDREKRQAVWVGWASKRLSKSDDSAKVIQAAVEGILKPFPAEVQPAVSRRAPDSRGRI